jgi:hypothetical protein
MGYVTENEIVGLFHFHSTENVLFSPFSDMKDRTYINTAAEILCDKLEAVKVAAIPITPLKLLAVQVEVSLNYV